jgi:antibiotic biosynthesis monooxygenase (ABM) superfamily enzyme
MTVLALDDDGRTLTEFQAMACWPACSHPRKRLLPEAEFIEVWRQRDSRLADVPGFQKFNLLRGPGDAQATVFVSHSTWDSAAAFEAWTRSESFRAPPMPVPASRALLRVGVMAF